MTYRIHLDTDLGGDPDDVCALAMLLGRPDVEISGITTVIDEGGVRAGMAAYVCALAGRAGIPIAAGAAGSLGGYPQYPGLPDPSRYWPEPIPARPTPAGAAPALLEASIAAGAIIVGIGTYTNLAMLETMKPGILAGANLVLMGGWFGPLDADLPPWGADYDWNVRADTTAARIVFDATEPLCVPVAVTLRVALRHSHLPELETMGELGRLVARQARATAEETNFAALAADHPGIGNDVLNFHHDPLAAAVACDWTGVSIEERRVRPQFDDGNLSFVNDPAGRPVRVVTSVDAPTFEREFLACVARAGPSGVSGGLRGAIGDVTPA